MNVINLVSHFYEQLSRLDDLVDNATTEYLKAKEANGIPDDQIPPRGMTPFFTAILDGAERSLRSNPSEPLLIVLRDSARDGLANATATDEIRLELLKRLPMEVRAPLLKTRELEELTAGTERNAVEVLNRAATTGEICNAVAAVLKVDPRPEAQNSYEKSIFDEWKKRLCREGATA